MHGEEQAIVKFGDFATDIYNRSLPKVLVELSLTLTTRITPI
jgi:hypothetical protein